MDSSAHAKSLKALMLVTQSDQTFAVKFENLNVISKVTLLLILPVVIFE